MRRVWNGATATAERLEMRTLLSGAPLDVTKVPTPAGLELRIGGTPAADHITQTLGAGTPISSPAPGLLSR